MPNNALINPEEDPFRNEPPAIKVQAVDKVVASVREDLLRRSELGIKKYGNTLDTNARKDELRYWLQHAYEETLDQANYLKCAIMQLDGQL